MSGSKYVVETGDGYLGVHPVTKSRCQITSGTIRPAGFEIGDKIDAAETDEGVALVHSREELEALDSYNVVRLQREEVPCVIVLKPVLDAVGATNGGDLRVYERGPNSVLVVNADDDPRVRTERDHDG